MLEVKNIYKSFGELEVLKDVSMSFSTNNISTIIGPSGTGKSTLLNVISGMDSYEDGEMYINGKETSHYTEQDYENYRRKYILKRIERWKTLGVSDIENCKGKNDIIIRKLVEWNMVDFLVWASFLYSFKHNK